MTIRKFYIVALLMAFLVGCNAPQPTTFKENKVNDHNMVGHYQFFTTGAGFRCETIKQEFDLDTSGSFLYHVFCQPFNGDPTGVSSLLKPFSMIGKWTYTNDSSIIKLTADNGKVIRLKIIDKKIVDFLDENNKELPSQIFFSLPNDKVFKK